MDHSEEVSQQLRMFAMPSAEIEVRVRETRPETRGAPVY
jgi:hypothetical protein